MARVGLLTMSDGRNCVARDVRGFAVASEQALARMFSDEGGRTFSPGCAPPVTEFLSGFGANHLHAVPGDRIADLQAVCNLLGSDWAGMGEDA